MLQRVSRRTSRWGPTGCGWGAEQARCGPVGGGWRARRRSSRWSPTGGVEQARCGPTGCGWGAEQARWVPQGAGDLVVVLDPLGLVHDVPTGNGLPTQLNSSRPRVLHFPTQSEDRSALRQPHPVGDPIVGPEARGWGGRVLAAGAYDALSPRSRSRATLACGRVVRPAARGTATPWRSRERAGRSGGLGGLGGAGGVRIEAVGGGGQTHACAHTWPSVALSCPRSHASLQRRHRASSSAAAWCKSELRHPAQKVARCAVARGRARSRAVARARVLRARVRHDPPAAGRARARGAPRRW